MNQTKNNETNGKFLIFSYVSLLFVYFVFSFDLAKSLPRLNAGLLPPEAASTPA
jgi:hypothetical protein